MRRFYKKYKLYILIGIILLGIFFLYKNNILSIPRYQTIAGEMRGCSDYPDYSRSDLSPTEMATCPELSLMNVYGSNSQYPDGIYLYEKSMVKGLSWPINEYPNGTKETRFTKYRYECYACRNDLPSCKTGDAICWTETSIKKCINGQWQIAEECPSNVKCTGTPGKLDASCGGICVPKFLKSGNVIYDARRCPETKTNGGELCNINCPNGTSCVYKSDWNYVCEEPPKPCLGKDKGALCAFPNGDRLGDDSFFTSDCKTGWCYDDYGSHTTEDGKEAGVCDEPVCCEVSAGKFNLATVDTCKVTMRVVSWAKCDDIKVGSKTYSGEEFESMLAEHKCGQATTPTKNLFDCGGGYGKQEEGKACTFYLAEVKAGHYNDLSEKERASGKCGSVEDCTDIPGYQELCLRGDSLKAEIPTSIWQDLAKVLGAQEKGLCVARLSETEGTKTDAFDTLAAALGMERQDLINWILIGIIAIAGLFILQMFMPRRY